MASSIRDHSDIVSLITETEELIKILTTIIKNAEKK